MTHDIRSVAVFCGSNMGRGEVYGSAARDLGIEIGRRGLTLVYGGSHRGLMGIVADAVLSAGGIAFGVMTERLVERGHLHSGLSRHEVVQTMRARKTRMGEEADAFVALPGGIGTLEELMEIWTLNQLGDIDKPAGLLDVNGYYQPFMRFLDHMIGEGFLPAAHREAIAVDGDPGRLLDRLAILRPVTVPKWM